MGISRLRALLMLVLASVLVGFLSMPVQGADLFDLRVSIPMAVNEGEAFQVRVSARNTGGEIKYGSISIALPDDVDVEIVEHDTDEKQAVILFPPRKLTTLKSPDLCGQEYSSKSTEMVEARYVLAEAFYPETIGWQSNQTHIFQVKIKPRPNIKSVRVFVRAAGFGIDDILHCTPSASSTLDQQNFPTKEFNVRVGIPTPTRVPPTATPRPVPSATPRPAPSATPRPVITLVPGVIGNGAATSTPEQQPPTPSVRRGPITDINSSDQAPLSNPNPLFRMVSGLPLILWLALATIVPGGVLAANALMRLYTLKH